MVLPNLQLLISEDAQAYFAWVEETRQQVAVGIAELDRGEGIDHAGISPRLIRLHTCEIQVPVLKKGDAQNRYPFSPISLYFPNPRPAFCRHSIR